VDDCVYSRIDIIGQNGNDGLHYDQPEEQEMTADTQDKATAITVELNSNGTLSIVTSFNNTAIAHWLLNRAIFELNIHEQKVLAATQAEAPEEKAA
jgi:hypothetical protein